MMPPPMTTISACLGRSAPMSLTILQLATVDLVVHMCQIPVNTKHMIHRMVGQAARANGRAADASPDLIIAELQRALSSLSPRIRVAARYLLDHPAEIALSSMRQLAQSAKVPPNTLVRLAQALGFEGFEEFRQPFREAMRRGAESIPDRARSLQNLSRAG